MKLALSVLVCLALSAQALATETATQKASRLGRGDGGQNCSFVYQITKESPSQVRNHQEIRYKIRLDNLGNCDLRDVSLVDHLSRDVKFIDATPGFILQDDKVIYKDLRIEERRSLRFEIRVEADARHSGVTAWNTASAFAPQVGQRISATVGTVIVRH